MTPHEVNEPESPWRAAGRSLLILIQVTAMALCACLIARFIIEDHYKIPHSMCIDTIVSPVEDATPNG